jgi:excisionase family DNA binding protein
MERMTMTVVEMANCLGIGRNAAYDLVKKGRVPSLKIGRQIRIPKKAFELWLTKETEKDKDVSGF